MRPDPLRHLAAAIATLWLVVPAANALHGALSPHVHRYCGEHEVVEEEAANPAPDSAPSAAGQSGPLLVAAGSPAGDGGHLACPFACLGHLGKRVRMGASAILVRMEPQRLPVLPGTAVLVSVVSLSVAPKTSPPLS